MGPLNLPSLPPLLAMPVISFPANVLVTGASGGLGILCLFLALVSHSACRRICGVSTLIDDVKPCPRNSSTKQRMGCEGARGSRLLSACGVGLPDSRIAGLFA